MSASPADLNLVEMVERAEEAAQAVKDPARQRIAFVRVLDHLLSRSPSAPVPNGSEQNRPAGQTEAQHPLGSRQQRADEVAMYFGIDSERVGNVFELAGDEPELVLPTGRLGDKSAPATRKVALLVTGVRSALGLDTSTAHIRAAAGKLHVSDLANFNSTLSKMPELALLGSSGAKNRPVRLKTTGVARARELVSKLASE